MDNDKWQGGTTSWAGERDVEGKWKVERVERRQVMETEEDR